MPGASRDIVFRLIFDADQSSLQSSLRARNSLIAAESQLEVAQQRRAKASEQAFTEETRRMLLLQSRRKIANREAQAEDRQRATVELALVKEVATAREHSARAIEVQQRRASNAFRTALQDALLFSRGLTLLSVTNERSLERVVSVLVKFQAVSDTLRGSIGVIQRISDAWTAVSRSAQAASVSQGAAGAFGQVPGIAGEAINAAGAGRGGIGDVATRVVAGGAEFRGQQLVGSIIDRAIGGAAGRLVGRRPAAAGGGRRRFTTSAQARAAENAAAGRAAASGAFDQRALSYLNSGSFSGGGFFASQRGAERGRSEARDLGYNGNDSPQFGRYAARSAVGEIATGAASAAGSGLITAGLTKVGAALTGSAGALGIAAAGGALVAALAATAGAIKSTYDVIQGTHTREGSLSNRIGGFLPFATSGIEDTSSATNAAVLAQRRGELQRIEGRRQRAATAGVLTQNRLAAVDVGLERARAFGGGDASSREAELVLQRARASAVRRLDDSGINEGERREAERELAEIGRRQIQFEKERIQLVKQRGEEALRAGQAELKVLERNRETVLRTIQDLQNSTKTAAERFANLSGRDQRQLVEAEKAIKSGTATKEQLNLYGATTRGLSPELDEAAARRYRDLAGPKFSGLASVRAAEEETRRQQERLTKIEGEIVVRNDLNIKIEQNTEELAARLTRRLVNLFEDQKREIERIVADREQDARDATSVKDAQRAGAFGR